MSQAELSKRALALKQAAQSPELQIEPLLYSMVQTARRLNISRTMVYSEITKGELETVCVGDRRFTTDEQQRAYIARKQRKAARAKAVREQRAKERDRQQEPDLQGAE